MTTSASAGGVPGAFGSIGAAIGRSFRERRSIRVNPVCGGCPESAWYMTAPSA